MKRFIPAKTIQSVLSTEPVKQFLLIGLGLMISLPVIIAVFTSFKAPQDVIDYPPTLIPRQWTFENYSSAWNANRDINPDLTGLMGFFDQQLQNRLRTFFDKQLCASQSRNHRPGFVQRFGRVCVRGTKIPGPKRAVFSGPGKPDDSD